MEGQQYQNSSWLMFLSILTMTILLTGTVVSAKIVALTDSFIQPGSTVIFPLAFLLCSVIAEVFGYQTSKKLIWYVIICGYIFAFSVELLLMLPSPDNWQKAASYQDIFGGLLRFSTAGTLGLLAGLYTNSYIITKSKIILHGRYFWFRSLCAIAAGEVAHISISATLIFYNTIYENNIFNIIITMYLFRLCCAFILSYPAQILVALIQKTEGRSYNDYEIKFKTEG